MTKVNELMKENSGKQFEITRVINAPRELVFKVLTQAEHLVHWWGPKGFPMDVAKIDLRPGGMFHYCMKSPDGFEMWGRFVYEDIIAPERIVFVSSFSDAEGNITRAPMSEIWPLEVHNTMTLTEHEGKTTLTLRGGPINATAEERQLFEDSFANMQQGFGGTFDQLDTYLTTL
ncbi:MAG: SRPBCC domain-containing protein [Bacteroidota bacterium]